MWCQPDTNGRYEDPKKCCKYLLVAEIPYRCANRFNSFTAIRVWAGTIKLMLVIFE